MTQDQLSMSKVESGPPLVENVWEDVLVEFGFDRERAEYICRLVFANPELTLSQKDPDEINEIVWDELNGLDFESEVGGNSEKLRSLLQEILRHGMNGVLLGPAVAPPETAYESAESAGVGYDVIRNAFYRLDISPDSIDFDILPSAEDSSSLDTDMLNEGSPETADGNTDDENSPFSHTTPLTPNEAYARDIEHRVQEDDPVAKSELEETMFQIDFSGVFPAMVTPFTEDNEIDTETLRADAQRLEAAGVDGLVPVGSTGESATLSHAEHVEVIEAVVDAVEDVPVIAGTGSNNTIEALDLSQRAADAGADALLLISPYYNKPEPEGMYDHYEEIADAVDLPQILYNVPSRTGRNIAVDTAVDLADHPNIAGYKAASGDLNRISEVIERTRDKEFAVLSGDDGMTLPILAAGGHGAISVVANVEPERACAMVGAALEGDYAFARTIHHELGPLTRQLFVETNPIPVKAAMAMRGYAPERIRSPLTELSEEHREELQARLDELDSDPTEPADVDAEATTE